MKKHSEWIEDLLGAAKISNNPQVQSLIRCCGEGCARRKNTILYMNTLRKEAVHCKTIAEYTGFLSKRMPVRIEAAADGIIMHLGKDSCSCPLAPDLNQNAEMLCECTSGHEIAAWSAFFGKPVNVEIVESILRGGQDCVIKIIL